MLRRAYVLPEDMTGPGADVLRHRWCCPTRRWPKAWMRADDDPAVMPPAAARRRAAPTAEGGRRRGRRLTRPRAAARASACCSAWMDGAAPPGRPAAGRLPHADARRRHRPGRPARVPAARRRAPHRLERHRPAGDAPCAPVHRGPRDDGLVPARPEPSSTSARRAMPKRDMLAGSSACWRADPRHGNRVGALRAATAVAAMGRATRGRQAAPGAAAAAPAGGRMVRPPGNAARRHRSGSCC